MIIELNYIYQYSQVLLNNYLATVLIGLSKKWIQVFIFTSIKIKRGPVAQPGRAAEVSTAEAFKPTRLKALK